MSEVGGADGLRKIALLDLARGARLMLKVQDEIDPQFRIATPEGDVALSITFPEDVAERRRMLERVRRFCAWKQALAYTMTFNLKEPNALMTVGVSRREVCGCVLRVSGEQGGYAEESFGKPAWVTRDSLGDELVTLLPGKMMELSSEELKELELWFGPVGRFPAVHLPSGGSGL